MIFGIDPSATADDGSMRSRDGLDDDNSSNEFTSESAHDRIPFTGVIRFFYFYFYYFLFLCLLFFFFP